MSIEGVAFHNNRGWFKVYAPSTLMEFSMSLIGTGLVTYLSWDSIKDSDTNIGGATLAIVVNNLAVAALHLLVKVFLESKKEQQINKNNLTKKEEDKGRDYLKLAKKLEKNEYELLIAKKNDEVQKMKDKETRATLSQEKEKSEQELEQARLNLFTLNGLHTKIKEEIEKINASLEGKNINIELQKRADEKQKVGAHLDRINLEIEKIKKEMAILDALKKEKESSLGEKRQSIKREKELIEQELRAGVILKEIEDLNKQIEQNSYALKKKEELVGKVKHELDKKKKDKERLEMLYKDAFANYQKYRIQVEMTNTKAIKNKEESKQQVNEEEVKNDKKKLEDLNKSLQTKQKEIEDQVKKLEALRLKERENDEQKFASTDGFKNRKFLLDQELINLSKKISSNEGRLKILKETLHIVNQNWYEQGQKKQELELETKQFFSKIKKIEDYTINLTEDENTSLPDGTALISILDLNECKQFQECLSQTIKARENLKREIKLGTPEKFFDKKIRATVVYQIMNNLGTDTISVARKKHQDALLILKNLLIQLRQRWEEQNNTNNQEVEKFTRYHTNVLNYLAQAECKNYRKCYLFIQRLINYLNSGFGKLDDWNDFQKWREEEINQYKAQISTDREEHHNLTKEVEYIENTIKAQTEINNQRKKIEKKKDKADLLKAKIDLKIKELELKKLNDDLERIKKNYINTEADLTWVKTQSKKLDTALKELNESGIDKKIKKFKEDSAKKISSVEQEIADIEKDKQILASKFNEQLLRARAEATTELERADKELKLLRQEREHLAKSLEGEKASYQKLEGQILEAESMCDGCLERNQVASDQYHGKETSILNETKKREEDIKKLEDSLEQTTSECKKARADWDEAIVELERFKIRTIRRKFLKKAKDVCINKEKLYKEKADNSGSNGVNIKLLKEAVLNATLEMKKKEIEFINTMKAFGEKVCLDIRQDRQLVVEKNIELNALEALKALKIKKYELINLQTSLYQSCEKWKNKTVQDEKYEQISIIKKKEMIEQLFSLRSKFGPFKLWKDRHKETGKWKTLGEIKSNKDEYKYHKNLCELKQRLSIINLNLDSQIMSLRNSCEQHAELSDQEKVLKQISNDIQEKKGEIKESENRKLSLYIKVLQEKLKLINEINNKKDNKVKANEIKASISSSEKKFIEHKLQALRTVRDRQDLGYSKNVNLILQKIAFFAPSAFLYLSGAKNPLYQMICSKTSVSWQLERVLWMISSMVHAYISSPQDLEISRNGP